MRLFFRHFPQPSQRGHDTHVSPNPLLNEEGMTFIEIIFSVMILLVLTITSANMIRNGIDMRIAISDQSRVTHRIQTAAQTITNDLEHAYLLSRKKDINYMQRATKTIYESDMESGNTNLKLTTMTRTPLREHAKESSQTFVVYRLERDEKTGLTNLYRGETAVIPQDFKEEVPMQILAKYVKTFKILNWDGDRWQEDWNSDRSDYRDLLPPMVQVVLEAWDINPKEEEPVEYVEQLPTTVIRTVVYLPKSWGMKQPKKSSTTIKYF